VWELIDPCNGQVFDRIEMAGRADVDKAVAAAVSAQPDWAAVPLAERAALLRKAAGELRGRLGDLIETITMPLGLPRHQVETVQIASALTTLETTADIATELVIDEVVGNSLVMREPAGVVAAIAPWNYPLMQSVNKVAPALVAGCSVVLKPSELTPLDAAELARAFRAAGLPAGVLHVLPGDGPQVGRYLAGHPDVDVVSFTGSTRAGTEVAATASATVKRTLLELGGKSACVVLDDADLEQAVAHAVRTVVVNAGQTCTALSRLIVPRSMAADAEAYAVELLRAARPGHRDDENAALGPVISAAQRDRVRRLIQTGVDEGARVSTGGIDPPPGLPNGYFVRPTLLTGVRQEMTVANEEIFGPVLTLLDYDDPEEAVRMANDTRYGLSGAVWSGDTARAMSVARRLRTGQVSVNGGPYNPVAPFGGYKQSGVGREKGRYGIEEFFELKAVQIPADLDPLDFTDWNEESR